MTAKFISNNSVPTYLALSTDITAGSSIAGVALVGKTVYLTDTQEWKIVKSDLTLSPYTITSIIDVSPTT